ncbi:hypothetical protein [Haloarcula montana]|uniref:hypothetical protein n=1 Tax=Haloarcula montana TaxID=3111776 RepID=UPI002D773772|nr:hypothetical protein [Haloarcula sp. GH36]
MSLDRRRFLAAGAGAASALTAGCTGRLTRCLPFADSGMPHDAAIAVTSVGSVPYGAPLLDAADLPDRERDLLRTAIDDGVVRACMRDETDRTGAFSAFADRVDQETYLAAGPDRYALWVRITDQVFAATGDSPAGDASPCC